MNSVRNARVLHAPAVFLLAQDDEMVKPEYQQLVVKAYAGQKQIINLPGAHHNDPLEATAIERLDKAIAWILGSKYK